METTMQSSQATQQGNYSSASRTQSLTAYDKFIESLKFSHFGIISMTILIGSIIGGITAMYIFKNNAPIWQLGVCMSAAMINLVAAISQAPTKWVVNSFIILLVVSAILIGVNI